MKAQIPFLVQISSIDGNCQITNLQRQFEVVCVYGTPSADPESTVEIPLTIKEVLFGENKRPLDWHERNFFLEMIGGPTAIEVMVRRERPA